MDIMIDTDDLIHTIFFTPRGGAYINIFEYESVPYWLIRVYSSEQLTGKRRFKSAEFRMKIDYYVCETWPLCFKILHVIKVN